MQIVQTEPEAVVTYCERFCLCKAQAVCAVMDGFITIFEKNLLTLRIFSVRMGAPLLFEVFLLCLKGFIDFRLLTRKQIGTDKNRGR
jgi:hypothetical protein